MTVTIVVLVVASNEAFAQAPYPNKPIRLIVPFPPGGSNDLVARYIGQKLTARLGQQTVIDNRAGADGIIGTQLAANAVPDGYTLLAASITHTMTPATQRKLPYDPLNTLTPLLPHARSGRLKILGVSGTQRAAALPDVPTVAEAGVPGYEASIWWGVLGPAGLPREFVNKLNQEINAIVRDAESVRWLTSHAADPLIATPDEFAKRMVSDISKWHKVAREAGINIP